MTALVPLRDGVLGKLSWEEESDGGLDLSGGEGVSSVVSDKSAGLGGDLLEDVVDERVHDGHSLLGDTGIGVDLLQDLVDVRAVRFGALLALSLGTSLLGGGSLLGGLLGGSLGHFGSVVEKVRI